MGTFMQTLAVINQKGGTGKTTTAVNLPAALAEKGKRSLVIDLDPQAHASSWLGVEDGGRGLFDAIVDNGNLIDLVAETAVSGVDLIPGSTWLAGVEKALSREVGAEAILRRMIAGLPDGRWDFIFVDCPPALALLSLSALTACDGVIVPVQTEYLAVKGMAALTQTIERVRERLNPSLALAGVLPFRVEATNLSQDAIERLRKAFGALVYHSVIRKNVRLGEAPSFHQPITVYAPTSVGAEDFRALAAEFLTRRHAKRSVRG
jgi:chromosome partitioning protein